MKKIDLLMSLCRPICLSVIASCVLMGTPSYAEKRIHVSTYADGDFYAGINAKLAEIDAEDDDVSFDHIQISSDADIQLSEVKRAISEGYDGYVLASMGQDEPAEIERLLADAGKPLVYLNVVPPVQQFKTDSSIVASNDLVAGRLQMRLAANAIGGNGNVVYIQGSPGSEMSAPSLRARGAEEILEIYPGVQKIRDESAGWSPQTAEELVGKWLDEGNQIDAIVCQSDGMALGAVQAIRKRGIPAGEIVVIGVDGHPDALEEIKNGYISYSLFQDGERQAHQSVENIKRLMDGEYAQQFDWVGFEIITQENIANF